MLQRLGVARIWRARMGTKRHGNNFSHAQNETKYIHIVLYKKQYGILFIFSNKLVLATVVRKISKIGLFVICIAPK